MTDPVYFRDGNGRMLDLMALTPADIDFPAIASALSKLNRFAGNTAMPINVAQHSLIAAECAVARGHGWAVPWVLLHDAHEAFIGDITTPAAHFLNAMAQTRFDLPPGRINQIIHAAKSRLDATIYTAAKLSAPDLSTCKAIAAADRDAYLVELRDFHRGVREGDFDFQAMTDIGKIMPRRQKPMSAADSEIALMQALRQHLPCYGAAMPDMKGAA